MNEILSFSIDYYKVLEDDQFITLLEAYIVSEGSNLHGTYFTLDAINEANPTLCNKPIVAIWNNGDFKEHARNKEDIKKRDAIGTIPESCFPEIVEYEGKNFLKCRIAIWKYYFPDFAKKLNNNEKTKLSMEILAEQTHKREDGYIGIDKYSYIGISVLGEKYISAVPNANMKVIKYSTSDYSDMVNNTNKQLSQFDVPESMKENIKKALEPKQEDPELINFAKEIVDNEKLSLSKINWILNKIQNLEKEDDIIFFGGIESKEWCESIIQQFSISPILEEKEEELVLKENVEKVQLKFGLNSSQIREILNNDLSQYKYKSGDYEWGKYYVEAYDEEFVYVWDCEDSNNKRMTYTISENVANVDISSAEEVISAGYMPVGSKTEPLIDDNVDTIDYKAKFEEMSAKYDEVCGRYSDMEIKYSTIETEKNELTTNYSALETDLESLKLFKAETEKANLETKANVLYSKYESYITEQEKEDLNVKLFSVDNFDIFKEKLFAIVTPKIEAENIALKQNATNDPDKIQFSTMPLLDGINKDENKSSFEKLKEYANS